MASPPVTAGHADAAATRRGRPPAWLEFALIFVACYVAGGAAAPHINETHYLLKAKHYWDPSFCPGDMFLDSADAHLPFFWTVGWLTKFASLEAAAWIGRAAAWALISFGWLRLARAVTDAPWAATLSAIAWLTLVDVCDFAGEWVVGGLNGKGGVEGKCFAYGLVLLGLAAIAAGRWTTPWMWFGAAAAMHVLVGGWAVLAGLGAWLVEPRDRRTRVAAVLPGLLLGGVLALPGLLPAAALDRDVSVADARAAAEIYVYQRLPHHLAPHTLPAAEFRGRLVRFGVLTIALAAFAAWVARQSHMGAGAVARDWQPAAMSRIMHFAGFALVGNCLGMAIELALDGRRELAASLLRFYWYRQADVIVPAAVALAGTCALVEFARRSPARARLAVAVAMLACGGHFMAIAADRWRNPYPPGVSRMENAGAWLAVCEWLREHAPADAVCLVPRQAQSFKWYAQRADVANWKDVPQDARGVIQWKRRIDDVFPTVETPAGPVVLSSPEQWGARRALEAARRYGATYIVARSEPPLGLDEVAVALGEGGGGYAVYRVQLPGNGADDAATSNQPPSPAPSNAGGTP
jgi:hypothetical protein